MNAGGGGLRQHAEALAELLGKVVHEPDDAKRLATRAGFPVEHVPRFDTAAGFWRDVVEAMVNGQGDLTALARIAADQYVGNARLRELARALETLQAPLSEHAPLHPLLVEHRDRLVRQLSLVKVLRNIADNEAGRGQSRIRLEEVFVCPRLVSETIQERLVAYDRELLDREPGQDRSESARYGEHVRWQPESWAASTTNVGRALAEHRTLLVVGDPGSGKSTLLAALVLATGSEQLSQELAGASGGLSVYGRVPFYLRLPQLGSRASSEEIDLRRSVSESVTVPVSLEQVDYTLRGDQAIVLLDALDEVPSSVARQRIADAIESFCTDHPKCPVVVTTREGGRTMIPGFTAVHLPPMTHADMDRFISRWRKALGQTTAHEPHAPHTVDVLGELGRNPLMLLVMLLSGGIELRQRERVLFYDRALQTMLITWRGSPDHARDPTTRYAWRAWGEVALRLRGDDTGGVLPRPALERRLREALNAEGAEDAEALAPRLVDEALRKSGLVIRRGHELGFWHSTFGEYLAATALARDTTLDRFMDLRRDHRNVEVAAMTIDYLAHVEGDEHRAVERLRALLEQRDPWDDLDGTQLGFAVECLLRKCHAQRDDIDRCLEILLRLCREFPYADKHRTTFSRLATGLPKHVPREDILAALARVVGNDEPLVDLDDVAPMLASACPSQPVAVATCEALLGRPTSAKARFRGDSRVVRAFAALGLVRSGRLDAQQAPALVDLPWFSDPHRGRHPHSEDALEPRTDGASYVGLLRHALVTSGWRLSPKWILESTDPRQRASISLLVAVTNGTNEPDATTISSLIETATSHESDAVRDNARGILGRMALHHHAVRSELLCAAFRSESPERSPGLGLQVSEPGNWAQPMLVRTASSDPRGPTWLIDAVARAAFSSLIESRHDQALHFLRYTLHERRDWYPLLVEAVRQRRTERELWPRLAAFTLLLGGSSFTVEEPDQEIWLACVRSEDPWFQLVALERWHPTPWPGDALAEEIIDAFVGACTELLAHPPRESPPADDRLAVLVRDTSSSIGSLGARWAAEHWLEYALDGKGPAIEQVIDAIRRRLSTSPTERAITLALILVEAGGAAEISEAMDVIRRHGLGSTDPAARARAARWLATHAQHSSAELRDELRLAMLGRPYWQSSKDYAETISGMGPPSNELIHRMVTRERRAFDEHLLAPGWLFSNSDAVEILIGYLRDDVPEEQYAAAYALLATDPKDEEITNAILTRAQAGDPDTCCRLASVLVRRLGERSSEDPRLDELWSRALASSNHSNLYRALSNLPRPAWLGADRAAVRAAIRRLLADDSPALRILTTWLLRWHGEQQRGGSPSLAESIATASEALGVSTQEVVTGMVACLDAPEPQLRLLAVCFLLGLGAAPESCKTTLRQLMETEGEAATEPLLLWRFLLISNLTIEGLLDRVLRGVLRSPSDVLRTKPNETPNLRDVTELLRWIYDDGDAPTRVDEILRGLGDPADEKRLLAAVCLARSPIAKVREPAFLAITNAIEGNQDANWRVYQNAVELIAEPDRFEAIMAWSMTVAQSTGHDSVASQLDWATKDEPRLRQQVFEWLGTAAVATEAGHAPRRIETAIHLMFEIEQHAQQSGRIPSLAIPRPDQTHESAADYLRARWRELPLSPEQLLYLVTSVGHFHRDQCPGLRSEIIEHFFQSPNRETRALALEGWSVGSDRNRSHELALQVWREISEARGSRSLHGASSIAIDLVAHDSTAEDVLAFLRDCANDPGLPMNERTRVLSALDRSPAERPWVETLGLELLESSQARDRQTMIEWWVERQLARGEALPLPLIHALVQIAPSGWVPGRLHHSRDPRNVPLTDTPFDHAFAEVFAKLLHEDPTALRALFDAAQRNAPLSPDQRDHILRTLRALPTDDPTTRLARRWWHHQLHLPPSSDPLDRLL